MLYILAIIIILYTSAHFVFKKDDTYIKVRKYIDIATVVVTSILVISWVEVFKLSFFIIIYFFLSLGVISYLVSKLRELETKKDKAQEVIKELKTEEKILENEIKILENAKN